jgi:hypothetical protein
VDERLNKNRYPLHISIERNSGIDCGDLADLTPLAAVSSNLNFKVGRNDKGLPGSTSEFGAKPHQSQQSA